MRVKPETRACTRVQSREKSPKPFSTTTVGRPFPVQFTCSRWPPRSTSFPGGLGSEVVAAKTEHALRMIKQMCLSGLKARGVGFGQTTSRKFIFSPLRSNLDAVCLHALATKEHL